MADFSRPFASSDDHGDKTLRPGQLLYHAAKHCECWAATPVDAPFGPRNTIGTENYANNTRSTHPDEQKMCNAKNKVKLQ